ncbi:MAG: hypothetical protein PVJ33_11860 [Lysobacterales bacterium]|jgi:uncharacterized protein (DUF1330 family)
MTSYLNPTDVQGARLFSKAGAGSVTMLNLLRFREEADYSACPELAPPERCTGREAFRRYVDHTLPLLERSGGELVLLADADRWFIGPEDEHWDQVMLVRQHSLQAFLAFASDEKYLAGLGHRTAALADSRLLPLFGAAA